MDEYIIFVLKSIWLFILGAGLAVLGLITLLTRPDMGSNPFIIMLMGLFFTGVGSIYGKKKLKGGGTGPSDSPRGIFEYQGGETFRQQQEDMSEQFLEAAEDGINSQPSPQPVSEPVKAVPVQTPALKQEPELPVKSTEPVFKKPTGTIKITICPKCGSENKSENRFCFKCGKKLLTAKKIAAKKKVKKTKSAKKKPVKKTSKKSKAPEFSGIDI